MSVTVETPTLLAGLYRQIIRKITALLKATWPDRLR